MNTTHTLFCYILIVIWLSVVISTATVILCVFFDLQCLSYVQFSVEKNNVQCVWPLLVNSSRFYFFLNENICTISSISSQEDAHSSVVYYTIKARVKVRNKTKAINMNKSQHNNLVKVPLKKETLHPQNGEKIKVEIHSKYAIDKLKTQNESNAGVIAGKLDSRVPINLTSTVKSTTTTTTTAKTATLNMKDAAASKSSNNAKTMDDNDNDDDEKKRIASMTPDEIIEQNLKELLERQSREERKANGRLIAVIVAFLVIFLAIYHAWIRKTAVLAGVLVPAAIMLSYAGWVVILARRDKKKRALFEKHLEEVSRNNTAELEAKMKRAKESATKLHIENEKGEKGPRRGHRKQRNRHRTHDGLSNSSGSISSGSGSTSTTVSNNSKRIVSSHTTTTAKDMRTKRPSIRQKLFRQKATTIMLNIPLPEEMEHKSSAEGCRAAKSREQQYAETKKRRKKLQRLNALEVPSPQLIRMGSAP